MDSRAHLFIQSGPDAGREIRIDDPAGIRMGRASKNDFVLGDPKTSRYHCRFFLRPGDGLWVSDLGSANQTLVNGLSIREVRLKEGDLVTLGDTVLRVVHDADAAAAPGAVPRAASATVDLGLGEPELAAPTPGRRRRGPLKLVLVLVVLAAIGAWLPRLLAPQATDTLPAATGPAPAPPLQIEYEKVLGDTNRIFRYHLTLGHDRRLAVRIDDTDSTHLFEEGTVEKALVDGLARDIDEAGFLELAENYQGLQPNVFEQLDLTVTLGARTKRSRVLNRAEPDPFKTVRERLESFAQVELGLWAIQYPPEQLVRMANEAYLDGRKRFDERQMAPGNLATAIRRMKDADFFLKTIDPKPEFYPQVLVALTEYNTELDQRYIDQNFHANRAVRTKEWTEAARELRLLCDILGDRNDPRFEDARQRLLDVESRINMQRR